MNGTSRGALAAPWLAGLALGVLILGPALGPGSLLNLDLVITPTIPVPRGVWALGPEVSRRVPLGVVLAWVSAVVGGPVAGKALFLVSITVAFAGTWRLADRLGMFGRAGAALLYAANPFLLTRVAVGHWGVVAAMAVLPWAVRDLLRPADDLRRTWLWSVALAFTGITGGMYGAMVVAVGLVADRGRRAGTVIAVFLAAQLPWIIPGIFSVRQVGRLSSPKHFATDLPLPAGLLRLVAGAGFWRTPSQVGGRGAAAVLLGAVLLALAIAGATRLPRAWGRRALVVALVGLAITVASALPGVRVGFNAIADTSVGAPFRDSQRLLAPFILWVALAAASGAVRLGKGAGQALEPTVEALPAVAAVVLAAPGLWGVGGALEPVAFPSGWAEARTQVDRAPGPVLALPWHQYLDLRFAEGRRVLNPAPDYFGGDVLTSSDPELDTRRAREQGDPREPHVIPVLEHLDRSSTDLRELGIRWVVLLHEVDWRDYLGVERDPGLQRVVATSALDLYRVRDWRGPVFADDHRRVRTHTVVAPFSWVDASSTATWTRPAASGWLRGTEGTASTPNGLLRLPAGSGPVWYWPAALAIGADVVVAAGVVVAFARSRRRSVLIQ